MSNIVEHERANAKKFTISVEKVLMGILGLGVAALLAYQVFGCASCYG